MDLFKIEVGKNRILGLDILRAIAILMVLYAHSTYYLKEIIPAKFLQWFMFDGVSVFFVLSGFLIGGILINTIEKEGVSGKVLIHFLSRRWLRTLPLYYFVLCLIIVLSYLIHRDMSSFNLWSFFVFLQNFNKMPYLFFTESWSLSVEEWFYLSVPFSLFCLLFIFKGFNKAVILSFAIVFIAVVTIYRIYVFYPMEASTSTKFLYEYTLQVIVRIDSIMFGMIGAFLNYYYQSFFVKNKGIKIVIGIMILLLLKVSRLYLPPGKELFIYKHWHMVLEYSLISVSVLLMLPWFSTFKEGSGKFYKLFSKISILSYSLYLIHLSIVMEIVVPRLFNILHIDNSVVVALISFFVYVVLSVFFSILTYKYIEQPFMNFRNRLIPH